MPHVILRPYILSLSNRLRPRFRSPQEIRRNLLLMLVSVLFMICIFAAFALILGSLRNDPLFRQIVPQKIVELLLYGFLILLLFSTTVSALGRVYNAEVMELLLSTPISSLRLFFAKFFEVYFETTSMLFIFLIPTGLAYWYSLSLGPSFVAALIAIVAILAAVPAGLSFVFATIFTKMSARLWKRGGLLVFAILFLGIWGIWSIANMLQQITLERGGTNAIVQLIGLFDNPNPLWLPSRWAAEMLAAFWSAEPSLFTVYLTLLLSTALSSITLGYVFFDAFLLSVRTLGVTHEQQSPSIFSLKKDLSRQLLERIYACIPFGEQFRAIIVKDLTSLIRDRAQSLQLMMYLGIALVALVIIQFMSGALNLTQDAAEAWSATLFTINYLFVGFIVTALMTRLVYPSISLEGKAYWILRTAPIALGKVLEAKFWCWLPFVCMIAIALLCCGAAAIHASLELILCSVYLGCCLSLGCTGLAIGIGATFATFHWESPSQIASGFGTLVLLLSSLLLVIASAVPAMVLFFIYATLGARYLIGLELTPIVAATCFLFVFLLNSGVAYTAYRRGVVSLEKRNIA